MFQQESRRAYGTAVSKVVIRLNKIHLNHSQILTIAQCSNDIKPNLTPNPKNHHNPNPKSCSKYCCNSKSNLSF